MKNNKKMSKGITLIALVVTIIVLLLLAGISIQMLTGNNGILNRADDAITNTTHKSLYEAIQLEYIAFYTEKQTGKTTKEFIEYFLEKNIIESEYQEGTEKYQIKEENLIGTAKYGKGNAKIDGLVDVYMLEKQTTSTGKIKNTKIASTKPIKIAETSSNNDIYEVVYYGTSGESSKVEIGSITLPITDNAKEVLAYYNADENYNPETWGDNCEINPEKLTFIGLDEGDTGYYRYTDGKIYKITTYWNDEKNRPIATIAEQANLDSEITTINGKKQIQTHFGTFTEDNERFYYDEENNKYKIYNSFDCHYYYYDDVGKFLFVEETFIE